MICSECGAFNVEGASFCTSCGQRLSVAEESPLQQPAQPEVQPVAVPQPVAAPQSQPQPAQPAYPPVGAPQPQPAQPAYPPVAAPQPQSQPGYAPIPAQQAYQQVPPNAGGYASAQPVYAQGCLATAWEEFSSQSGWFKKMLLLGLIFMVPILNFCALGYSLTWARSTVFGRKEPLPEKIVNSQTFQLGFYGFVVSLVVGVVSYIADLVLLFIPIFGTLVGVVLSVFLGMFACLCCLRVAITGRLGAAFEIGVIWNRYKQQLGALFCASMLPSIICSAFAFVVTSVATFIVMMAGGLGVVGLYEGASYNSAMVTAGAFGLVIAFVLILVVMYVVFVASAIATLVSYKAAAHWVARFAPEWAQGQSYAQQPYQQPAQPYAQQPYQQPYAQQPYQQPYAQPPAQPYAQPPAQPYAQPVQQPQPQVQPEPQPQVQPQQGGNQADAGNEQ